MARRIMEVSVVGTIGTDSKGFEVTTGLQVFALCDDGTLWNRFEGITEGDADWHRIPPVPQTPIVDH